jgi:hypothetical protein
MTTSPPDAASRARPKLIIILLSSRPCAACRVRLSLSLFFLRSFGPLSMCVCGTSGAQLETRPRIDVRLCYIYRRELYLTTHLGLTRGICTSAGRCILCHQSSQSKQKDLSCSHGSHLRSGASAERGVSYFGKRSSTAELTLHVHTLCCKRRRALETRG